MNQDSVAFFGWLADQEWHRFFAILGAQQLLHQFFLRKALLPEVNNILVKTIAVGGELINRFLKFLSCWDVRWNVRHPLSDRFFEA